MLRAISPEINRLHIIGEHLNFDVVSHFFTTPFGDFRHFCHGGVFLFNDFIVREQQSSKIRRLFSHA